MSATRVIVVANEKGGSGKSTVAMHIAITLLKSGQRVATIDLDTRQRSFTHYIENQPPWPNYVSVEDEAAGRKALTDAVDALGRTYGLIVIDTPGHDNYLMRLAHSLADTLVTPLNDSFVDFEVLGPVDPETFGVTGTSHYSRMVQEARRQRQLDQASTDWIVLRNRISMLGSRNKRLVGGGLKELSRTLNFRCIEGLTERVIFRELYPRGLTAVDDLDEITFGARPTMSHVTARLEMQNLLSAMLLGDQRANAEMAGRDRGAA